MYKEERPFPLRQLTQSYLTTGIGMKHPFIHEYNSLKAFTTLAFPQPLQEEESEEECCGPQCQIRLLRVPCHFWFSRDLS